MTWFNRLRNWQNDANNGIGIRADYHDEEDNNFASGINQCLNIAGANSPTNNISMGNFKFTNVAVATSGNEFATLGQVQANAYSYAVDVTGTSNYAITVSPALTAYAAGQVFRFKAGSANTGTATLNINGLGAKTIKKDATLDLVNGDLLANQVADVIYDGTNFQLLSCPAGVLKQSGGSLYAVDSGAANAYVVALTPALTAYVAGFVMRFQATNACTAASTINVNGLGAKTIKKNQNQDLQRDDIKANQIVEIIYDGTNFQLLSPANALLNQSGSAIYAADTGAADAYVITLTPAPTAYVAGQVFNFKVTNTNTGASTINVNGLGAKTIKKNVSTDLGAGDLVAGQIAQVIYDGTNFQISNDIPSVTSVATGNGLTGGTITSTGTISFASATIVQMVTTSSSTSVNTSAIIPADTSIPQITEGTQLVTLNITPKSATSKLVIEFCCPLVGNDSLVVNTFALFQGATANALNAGCCSTDSVSRAVPFTLRHIMTSGTTGAMTFRIRYGPGSGTMYVLQAKDGTITYGGVPQYTFTIMEILP